MKHEVTTLNKKKMLSASLNISAKIKLSQLREK